MKILVTGGAGYIGSHTCVELLNSGYEIAVLDNLCNSCEKALDRVKEITGKDFNFYKCDLLDYDATEKVFASEKFDGVIHFAGLKAVGESVAMPLQYYHNNITGTLNLLKIMESVLTKREICILTKRYGLDGNEAMTLREVGAELQLSKDMIRKYEIRAKNKIRTVGEHLHIYLHWLSQNYHIHFRRFLCA